MAAFLLLLYILRWPFSFMLDNSEIFSILRYTRSLDYPYRVCNGRQGVFSFLGEHNDDRRVV